MTPDMDLDVDDPDVVATILRNAARVYGESAAVLYSDNDPKASTVWIAIARILCEAADKVDML